MVGAGVFFWGVWRWLPALAELVIDAELDHSLGQRAARRLRESESYEELELLARCDRAGRRCGAPAPELDEALNYLRDLAQTFGE